MPGLAITRRRGEKVIIQPGAGPVSVEVAQVQGSKVRLRFLGEEDSVIYREELIDQPGEPGPQEDAA